MNSAYLHFFAAAAILPFAANSLLLPAQSQSPDPANKKNAAQSQPAKKTWDNQTFFQKIKEIEEKTKRQSDKMVPLLLPLTKSDDLNDWQKDQIYSRLINLAANTDHNTLRKDIAGAVAERNRPMLWTQLAVRYASIKDDPEHKQVEEALKRLLALPASPSWMDATQSVIGQLSALNPLYFQLIVTDFLPKAQALQKSGPDQKTSHAWSPRQKFEIVRALAVNELKFKQGTRFLDHGIEELVQAAQTAKQQAAEEAKKEKPNGAVARQYQDFSAWSLRLIQDIYANDQALALKKYQVVKPVIGEEDIRLFELGTLGVSALKRSDTKTYEKLKEQTLVLPFGQTRTRIVDQLCRAASQTEAKELLNAELKNPAISDQQKFNLLSKIRNYGKSVSWFQRGFCHQNAYQDWRKMTDEMIALDAADPKKKLANFDFYRNNANTAFGYGDFDFAGGQIAEAVSRNRSGSMDVAMMYDLWKQDLPHLKQLIHSELEAAANKNDTKLFLRAILLFAEGKTWKDFDSAFAAEKLSDEQKMKLLRRVSELFYRAKQYAVCRDIYDGIKKNLFVDLSPKSYAVSYQDHPPRTADGFVRTPMYQDWKHMETRFVPYGDNVNIDHNTDAARLLKTAVQPTIPSDWKTGIYAVCDATGLHLFIRCDDPRIEEVVTGKRSGGSLECTFRPGEEKPYNMWFFNDLPQGKDEVNIDFASATPRYRLTNDHFVRDAISTPEGIVAHTFIPWIAFYDDLPSKGKPWHFGLQRWCSGEGGGQTISGQVHELGRMLQLQFRFTPAQEKAIKRHLCLTAFNRFKNSKTLPVWRDDSELGDPEFYEKELAAYVKELNEAGKELSNPNADYHMLFLKYGAQWAEFEYTVAEKRKNYLKKKLME